MSEISPQVQAKLLRVLQERELERVGGNRTIKVDVRVLATTNRRLEESVERKEFRQDLYFRLNVVPIHVPPLREHKEDVPFLAAQFMPRLARKHGVRVRGFSDDCLAFLQAHRWPGNVRELQNVIERGVILCGDSGLLEPEHLGFSPQTTAPSPQAAPGVPEITTPAPPRPGRFPSSSWKRGTSSPSWTRPPAARRRRRFWASASAPCAINCGITESPTRTTTKQATRRRTGRRRGVQGKLVD